MTQQDIAATIVSTLVVLFFGAVLILLLVKPVSLTGELTSLLQVMLGALAAQFVAVVQYWLGSSRGSSAKDKTIADLSTQIKGG